MDGAALGAFVYRHGVDNAKRGRTALISTAAGLVFVLLGMLTAMSGGGASMFLFGGIFGVGTVLTGLGIRDGIGYLRGGNEAFDVLEGGLIHHRAGQQRVLPWEAIKKVTARKNQTTAGGFAAGWVILCRIHVRSGPSLDVTGYTAYAGALAQVVRQAVDQGVRPRADTPA